ncbi:acyltransferase family protein [Pseudomonas fluorescens]
MTSALKESPPTLIKDSTHQKYRPDIDGLRAIAVLAVVAFHAFPSKIKGGFIGVDVFFVISGFLISGIIMGHLKNNSFSLLDFYSRRVNRIFPALLLVMTSVWAFSLLSLFPIELAQLGKHMLGGATFVSNLVLLDEVGYFDSANETKLMLHLWSLGVEEQFYLIWPILLMICWRFKLKIIAAIITIGAVSFALNAYFAVANPSLDFYSPHTRFWELLFGAGLAYFANPANTLPVADSQAVQKAKNALSFIGLFLILIAIKVFSKRYMFPGWWALFPVVGASLIIYAGPASWVNAKLLSSRPMVAIGLISFPLYLWHWPILAIATEMNGETPSAAVRWALVALSFLLAWLTYKVIELPLRKARRKHVQSVVLTALMVVCGIAGYAAWTSAGFPERSNVKPYEYAFAQFVGPLWKYTKNDDCLNTYQKPKDLSSYQWYFCYASKNRAPDILLVGNSYANHLLPGIAQNANFKEKSVLSIGTCSPDFLPNATPADGTSPCSGTRPQEQTDIIQNIAASSPTVKWVILAGLENKTTPALIEVAKKKIDFFESTGATVLVFTPHLKIKYDIKSCYGRPLIAQQKDCKINAGDINKSRTAFQPFIDSMAKSNPRVKFFDTNAVFCSTGECSYIKDGVPLLRDDSSHFSEFGSIELAKLFVTWAKTNAPAILEN